MHNLLLLNVNKNSNFKTSCIIMKNYSNYGNFRIAITTSENNRSKVFVSLVFKIRMSLFLELSLLSDMNCKAGGVSQCHNQT